MEPLFWGRKGSLSGSGSFLKGLEVTGLVLPGHSRVRTPALVQCQWNWDIRGSWWQKLSSDDLISQRRHRQTALWHTRCGCCECMFMRKCVFLHSSALIQLCFCSTQNVTSFVFWCAFLGRYNPQYGLTKVSLSSYWLICSSHSHQWLYTRSVTVAFSQSDDERISAEKCALVKKKKQVIQTALSIQNHGNIFEKVRQ